MPLRILFFSLTKHNANFNRLGRDYEMVVKIGLKSLVGEMPQIENLDDFLLFPNPANRYVNINLEPIIGKEAEIYIYNNMGIQVKAIRLDEVTERTYTINLKELNEGFYHLWIVSPGRKAAVRKLMVGKR